MIVNAAVRVWAEAQAQAESAAAVGPVGADGVTRDSTAPYSEEISVPRGPTFSDIPDRSCGLGFFSLIQDFLEFSYGQLTTSYNNRDSGSFQRFSDQHILLTADS